MISEGIFINLVSVFSISTINLYLKQVIFVAMG